ncbi:MAG: glycosyl hydrolase family 25 [Eubacteriaceae bacterium]|nr:glycosyl hydrolase family 25 [Eubacteriaceae bacterium]
MSRQKWMPLAVGIGILILIALFIYGCSNLFGEKKGDDYVVKGVDLSAYQGNIDWKVLSEQGIDFAYIKATEGKDFVDEQFKKNWEASHKTAVKVGAYHFLSFDSTGKDQAKNFINNVPVSNKNLPPVVDMELYGVYQTTPMEKEKVKVILDEFLKEIENTYKVKPIIYTNQNVFNLYIGTDYKDYKIWIGDLDNNEPKTLPNGNEYTFWQYSQRNVLEGYKGTEKFIDMDIYNGTYNKFIKEFF